MTSLNNPIIWPDYKVEEMPDQKLLTTVLRFKPVRKRAYYLYPLRYYFSLITPEDKMIEMIQPEISKIESFALPDGKTIVKDENQKPL